MTLQVIPLGFHAPDRADAERQALAWAAREPNIERVSIVAANQSRPGWWTVDLDVTLCQKPADPQQEELGL